MLNTDMIKAMESDLPCTERPFGIHATRFGLTEETLIQSIKDAKSSGGIRRYGARLNHNRAGYTANVMVVWQVPSEGISSTVEKFVEHDAISHCYERNATEDFPYNLYTMIHGRSKEECLQAIKDISEKSGIISYKTLWTKREFKKSNPPYAKLVEAKKQG